MALVNRNKSNDPASLSSELATARQSYIAVRDDVIDRATARQNAISETIVDLDAERDALSTVVASAKSA